MTDQQAQELLAMVQVLNRIAAEQQVEIQQLRQRVITLELEMVGMHARLDAMERLANWRAAEPSGK